MFLYIDPSKHNCIRLIIFRDNTASVYEVSGKNRELLSVIDDIFCHHKLSLQDLRGIILLEGEGSFSSTRIATVVANSLSFTLHIPVVSTTRVHEPTIETVTQFFDHTLVGHYVIPLYSGEPNIGYI